MTQPYHIVHENIEQLPGGRWRVHYSDTYVQEYPDLPGWAKTTEKINQILDRSTEPVKLRQDFDEIYSLASADDFKGDRRHLQAAQYIQEVDQPENLGLLKEMFDLKLKDEHRSAAGCPTTLGLCNQIRIYNSVINKIEARLAELSV